MAQPAGANAGAKLHANGAEVQSGDDYETNVIALIQCEPALEAQVRVPLKHAVRNAHPFRPRFAGSAEDAKHALPRREYGTQLVYEHRNITTAPSRM